MTIAASALEGAFSLEAWEVASDGAAIALPGARGHLVYAPTGRVLALLAGPASAAHGFSGFLAYAARWTLVDDKVVHEVLDASVEGWAGKVLVRYAALQGDRLVLRTPPVAAQPGSPVHRLVWRRVV